MKKLYQISDLNTKNAVPDLFFDSKPKAVERRRLLNQNEAAPRYCVSPGPDHKKFISNPNH